jgi:hypothetical protein
VPLRLVLLAFLTVYHAAIPYVAGGINRTAYNGPVGLNLYEDDYPTAGLHKMMNAVDP